MWASLALIVALAASASGFATPRAAFSTTPAARVGHTRTSPMLTATEKTVTVADVAQGFAEKVGDFAEAEMRKQLAMQWAQGDGFWQPPAVELMALDFVFLGGIIGPLSKVDYLNTVGSFEIYKSFPDVTVSVAPFTQDPVDTDRYWSVVRVKGTHTKPQSLGKILPALPASRNKLEPGPQAISVTFDKSNKIKQFTGGYVADKREGNTGGYGAFFAVLKTIGVPIPPPELFTVLSIGGDFLKDTPKSVSHVEDLPGKFKKMGRSFGLRTADAWSANRFKEPTTEPKKA
mmetsp:Transcript_22837/g.52972  ORF Transcript_22837/g.52972 Transcript_22837/m.52972 type:complete len:289 (+) Transcript_22837:66-932(+)